MGYVSPDPNWERFRGCLIEDENNETESFKQIRRRKFNTPPPLGQNILAMHLALLVEKWKIGVNKGRQLLGCEDNIGKLKNSSLSECTGRAK